MILKRRISHKLRTGKAGRKGDCYKKAPLKRGAEERQYAIYCIGNELALLMVLLIRKMGDERIRGSGFAAALYGIGTLLLMQIGRGMVSLIFGTAPAVALGFITTDVVSLIFTAVILWIVRRLDGVLENQFHYLRRVRKEREREEGGHP